MYSAADEPPVPSGLFGLGLGLADWLGVLATIVAIIGVGLAVYFYRRQKTSKTLDYEVLSSQSLTTDQAYPGLAIEARWSNPRRDNIHKNLIEEHRQNEFKLSRFANDPDDVAAHSEEVKALWDHSNSLELALEKYQPITLNRPAVHTIIVKNTGTESIRADDFATPITVCVLDARVVDVTVSSTSVDDLFALGSISDAGPMDEVRFAPELMNASDWLQLVVLSDGENVLSDGENGQPLLQCRFSGQTRPMRGRVGLLATPRVSRVRGVYDSANREFNMLAIGITVLACVLFIILAAALR